MIIAIKCACGAGLAGVETRTEKAVMAVEPCQACMDKARLEATAQQGREQSAVAYHAREHAQAVQDLGQARADVERLHVRVRELEMALDLDEADKADMESSRE